MDIVVLNSGRSQRAEWTDIDPSVDAECFQINAIGPTHLARTILKWVIIHFLIDIRIQKSRDASYWG